MAEESRGNKTIHRGGRVLEALFEEDFAPRTALEISQATGIPIGATYRILQGWQELGWVVAVPISGGRGERWMLSERLVEISASYKRHALEQVKAIRDEHRRLTGEEL